MEWKVRGIRGATTVPHNTVEAITEAVQELLDDIEIRNELDPEDIVCAFFTATKDLDAMFPAAACRQRLRWGDVPLLDFQQMDVEDSLEHCIRVLIQVNTPKPQKAMVHCYLRQARNLRPDWSLAFRSLT